MKALSHEEGFLAIPEADLTAYANSKYVIQQVPYEHTSSYLEGSAKGPAAIVSASHFVEFYDEELDQETYKLCGIATLPEMNFDGKVDAEAVAHIEQETSRLIADGKYVVSLGAEHTVTNGFVQAHAKKFPNLTVLQIDAHSDLRMEYHGNPYSHASVMARIHEQGIPLVQLGIRAQCKEESDLIKSSDKIHTFYAHDIRRTSDWKERALSHLSEHVYLTIDADGFDPSIMPAVGTAEPNGLFWSETLDFLAEVFKERQVVGFDIVECAPMEGSILSEFTLAKLTYRLIGYNESHSKK
jgi:agmatinase